MNRSDAHRLARGAAIAVALLLGAAVAQGRGPFDLGHRQAAPDGRIGVRPGMHAQPVGQGPTPSQQIRPVPAPGGRMDPGHRFGDGDRHHDGSHRHDDWHHGHRHAPHGAFIAAPIIIGTFPPARQSYPGYIEMIPGNVAPIFSTYPRLPPVVSAGPTFTALFGQSPEQAQADLANCNGWAAGQWGTSGDMGNLLNAVAACMAERGYAVAWQ